MSDIRTARRTDCQICFDGVDITNDIRPYLLSVTFTDNETGEADDLQIKLQDRGGKWLGTWLNTAVTGAARGSAVINPATTPEKDKEYPTLKYGSRGSDVKTLQTALNTAGNYGLKVDGIFGTKTEAAVKKFQKAKGLTVSGICEQKTWAALMGAKVSAAAYKTGTYTVNAKSTLNVRSGPGTSYKIIGGLSRGKVITVTAVTGKWGKIAYSGKAGYVSMEYLKAGGSAQTATGESKVRGLRISAAIAKVNWDSKETDAVLNCGEFELDSIDVASPPSTVTIKATSLPYKGRLRQTKKTRAWENYTLSKIAGQIAKQNGMALMFEADDDPYYKRAEQIGVSDIAFLQKLCRDSGASLKVTSSIVVIFNQSKYENKEIMHVFSPGGGYLSYRLRTGEAETAYASCKVTYTDPASGKKIEGIVYAEDYDKDDETNQCLVINQKVTDTAAAKALAAGQLRLRNKYEATASFTLPGATNYAAGQTVCLTGFGLYDQTYIIKQCRHNVGTGGYTTDVTLRPALAAKKIQKTPSKKKQEDKKQIGKKVAANAANYLGTSYRKMDCSKLVQTVIKNVIGYTMPRTAAEQCRKCDDLGITSKTKPTLAEGDLIFYDHGKQNGRYLRIGHVAIYAGGGQVIEASSRKGKVVKRSKTACGLKIVKYADIEKLYSKVTI